MGFRINTNTASNAAQRALKETSRETQSTLEKLSSGSRINKAGDDAAGLAISEKLKATYRSLDQANRNANDGVSFIQVAEGGLNEVGNMLTRLRELAIQAASDTVGDKERALTDLEYQNLKSEIQRISETTEFNGTSLLDGQGGTLDFQIGLNNDEFQDRIFFKAEDHNAQLDELGIDGISVSSKDDARDGLEKIDGAIDQVAAQRANLGALQNRLTSTARNLDVAGENIRAANSRIRDVDYAQETAKNVRNNILTQAGVGVLSQANGIGQSALRLIG